MTGNRVNIYISDVNVGGLQQITFIPIPNNRMDHSRRSRLDVRLRGDDWILIDSILYVVIRTLRMKECASIAKTLQDVIACANCFADA